LSPPGVGGSGKAAWPQRTEDYQQNGYQNHPTNILLVSESRPLKSYSLRLQSRGLRCSIGHLWGVGAEFFLQRRRDQAMRWILILERHGVVRWILILERHSGL